MDKETTVPHHLRLDVITIFPAYMEPLRHALLGKAIEQGIISVGVHDLRQWASGVHKSVDDSPYGGGPGMVMKPDVWGNALDDVAQGTGPVAESADLVTAEPHRRQLRHDDLLDSPDDVSGSSGQVVETGHSDQSDQSGHISSTPVLVVPTPTGTPFTQELAHELAQENHLVFACGRYEGIDQRVFDDTRGQYRVQEVSIGDYVLVGGEVAVLVMAEAIVRLIPGVLGNRRSHEEDSFSEGLLEGPRYTKPRSWRGRDVPDILLSGDHAKVDQWNRERALEITAQRRPDLIERCRAAGLLSHADEEWLERNGYHRSGDYSDPRS